MDKAMNKQFTKGKCKWPIKYEKRSFSLGIVRTLMRYHLSPSQLSKAKKNDNTSGQYRLDGRKVN